MSNDQVSEKCGSRQHASLLNPVVTDDDDEDDEKPETSRMQFATETIIKYFSRCISATSKIDCLFT